MILHGSLEVLVRRGALALGFLACASAPAAASDRMGMPWDWSHQKLIYGNPDTPAEAVQKGTYNTFLRNYKDPRFVAGMVRKLEVQGADASAATPAAVAAAAAPAAPASTRRTTPSLIGSVSITPPSGSSTRTPVVVGSGRAPVVPPEPARQPPIHRDWSYPLGAAAGVGKAGTFPAKYAFDITATPNCTNDFVVYTTGSAGAQSGGGNVAFQYGDITGNVGNGKTVTIRRGEQSIVLTAHATQNTGFFFRNVTDNDTRAANLAAAITRNGLTVGVSGLAVDNYVGVYAIGPGTAGNSIQVSEDLNSFNWEAATLTSGTGASGQPTILAFNDLYSSCGSDFPSVRWAYNTGTGSFAETSPTISWDGSQVVFIQRSAGNVASLVILKWSAATPGTAFAPVVPTSVTAANYRSCTAPCMTVIPLTSNPNVRRSSPFYDYVNDQLWVGTVNGRLHRFTGVFNGTPAQSGSPWPVTVVNNRELSSPTYDPETNLVFVGSAREATTSTGGRLHSVNNGSGAVVTSGLLAGNPSGNAGSMGVAEAPIVDSLAHRVYTFVASDPSDDCDDVECHAVYQFPTTSSINNKTTPRVATGRGQIYTRVNYGGVFDNAYYSSANPANPSGFLYVCGSSSPQASSRQPTLWRIPITNNAMGTPVVGPTLVSADTDDDNGGCSPMTDVMNGGTNYVYVSVPDTGSKSGCTGDCIYAFNISAGTWNASKNAAAGLPAPGGTSGIIIDNISSMTGASQIYYATRNGPGNAIQASQVGLN